MKKKTTKNTLKELGMKCTHEIPGQNDGDGLPEGWKEQCLLEVAEIIMGQSPPSSTYNTEKRGLPFFQGKAEFGALYPEVVKYCDTPNKIAEPNDILISIRAPVGPTNLCLTKSCIGRGLAAIRPQHDMPFRYLLYFLRSIEAWLSTQGTGSTFTAINKNDLSEIRVPVPPLSEQRRIVSKLDELLGKVTSARQRLDKLPTLLKRFRQSVLAAACSGKLTEDWREENSNECNSLLENIKRYYFGQSCKNARKFEDIQRSCLNQHYFEELEFDTIPETWHSCRIGSIGLVCNGSTPSRREENYWGGNIPWISSGEVRNNIIMESREQITDLGYQKTSIRILPRGTVLIAMIGEGKTRGQSSILDIEATINQNIAAIDISHGYVYSKFLWHWLQMRYEATREQGSGSGPQALNCQRVRELPFVLPPLAEQREIVKRVELLFSFADRIESRLSSARASVEKLTQSILAKAFRGQLVATDAELGILQTTSEDKPCFNEDAALRHDNRITLRDMPKRDKIACALFLDIIARNPGITTERHSKMWLCGIAPKKYLGILEAKLQKKYASLNNNVYAEPPGLWQKFRTLLEVEYITVDRNDNTQRLDTGTQFKQYQKDLQMTSDLLRAEFAEAVLRIMQLASQEDQPGVKQDTFDDVRSNSNLIVTGSI